MKSPMTQCFTASVRELDQPVAVGGLKRVLGKFRFILGGVPKCGILGIHMEDREDATSVFLRTTVQYPVVHSEGLAIAV
jgi:hypothetical protein